MKASSRKEERKSWKERILGTGREGKKMQTIKEL